MRTTIRLPDDLLTDAKRHAFESGRTFTALVTEAIRQLLHRERDTSSPSPPPVLPTFKGTGTFPGVDLDDTSALLDRMEGLDDAPP